MGNTILEKFARNYLYLENSTNLEITYDVNKDFISVIYLSRDMLVELVVLMEGIDLIIYTKHLKVDNHNFRVRLHKKHYDLTHMINRKWELFKKGK